MINKYYPNTRVDKGNSHINDQFIIYQQQLNLPLLCCALISHAHLKLHSILATSTSIDCDGLRHLRSPINRPPPAASPLSFIYDTFHLSRCLLFLLAHISTCHWVSNIGVYASNCMFNWHCMHLTCSTSFSLSSNWTGCMTWLPIPIAFYRLRRVPNEFAQPRHLWIIVCHAIWS